MLSDPHDVQDYSAMRLTIGQSKAVLVILGLTALLSSCVQPDRTIAKLNTDELPFAQDMQKVLDLSLRITNGTGISAAVIIPGHGKWIGVSGWSEASKPISPDMLFTIASIGKNFVAILVCQLAEEGRLSLDDPLSKWLPDYPNINNTITIRQLLNHTSGIFDWVEHPQSPFRRRFSAKEVSSPEEVVTKLVSKPYFPPGKGFHYSSTNYTLLKMIVKQVTGSTVAEEIRARFLEPLDLNRTLVLDTETRIPETVSVAHAWLDIDGNGTLDDITSWPLTWIATRSQAMMYSTAENLARWSQALYGGEVLNRTSLEQVLTFHRPAPHTPFDTGYGLGTQELRLGGLVMWGHLGWHYGYTSSMLYIPKHSASVVVLINDNNMKLINMAAIALLTVMEYHLDTVPFLLLSGSALVLLSMFVLWPLSYAIQSLRKRGGGSAALTDIMRRKARTARWIALLAGISIAATAILYIVYSLNPATRLSWVGGNSIARSFIGLSMTSAVITLSLIYFTVYVWIDKLWSLMWRIHYSLITLAGLIAAYSLLRLLF
jgi:D-alanyl-D-alanine carboxypeptidase